jgi:predicted amidohydrolase
MSPVLLGQEGTTSAQWEPTAPRGPLRPLFATPDGSLSISGDGNKYEFGYWRARVECDDSPAYRLSVDFEVSEVTDLSLHVLNLVMWRSGADDGHRYPHDYVSHMWRQGSSFHAEETFPVPPGATAAEVQLGLRFAPKGTVTWKRVEFLPADVPPSRQARFAAVAWQAPRGSTLEANRRQLSELVERAANAGSDLVLLPESAVHNNTGLSQDAVSEPIPDGPTCALFSREAREHNMYICANITERSDHGIFFNTAILFGRDGAVVGTYRKVHPYWPEEIWEGISPGEAAPVFDLDFGRVGIIICYDSWFPETTRLLGLKGAEVILFPSAGYHPPLLPARAVDSRVYIVASSLYHPAVILDTLGNSLAVTESGLITACVDLTHRPTPHANAGGSLNTSPGGRRGTRNSLSARLDEELGATMADWQSDGAPRATPARAEATVAP